MVVVVVVLAVIVVVVVVVQHYSDWFCTAVMSNDVMKVVVQWNPVNTTTNGPK